MIRKEESMRRVLVIQAAITYLLVIGLITPAYSEEAYQFSLKWGSQGTGNGQFNSPAGVAVDSSGHVYVADTGNYRIQKFDSKGKFIAKWGVQGTGDAQLDGLEGMAVDGAGNVYVTQFLPLSSHWAQIQKFDSKGKFLDKWDLWGLSDGFFISPAGIAVDSSGNVYVADSYKCNIQKLNSSGSFITKLGSDGNGDGQLWGPQDVAVDSSGHVYVADTGNYRIQKFDSKGNFITKWGSYAYAIDDDKFRKPQGVTVDSSGNVYVVDSDINRIQKFDSEGNFITKWGSQGIGNGQFDGPTSVAVDSSGNVYVADTSNHRIQKFSPLPLPDLTMQWESLIQTCKSSKSGLKCKISGKLNIQNIGTEKATSSVGFYLSEDEIQNEEADIFLKQATTGSIKSGASKALTFTYNLPSGETASGMFIIAVIDANNTIAESNETNNVAVFGPIQ